LIGASVIGDVDDNSENHDGSDDTGKYHASKKLSQSALRHCYDSSHPSMSRLVSFSAVHERISDTFLYCHRYTSVYTLAANLRQLSSVNVKKSIGHGPMFRLS